jgi:hypothetical protein
MDGCALLQQACAPLCVGSSSNALDSRTLNSDSLVPIMCFFPIYLFFLVHDSISRLFVSWLLIYCSLFHHISLWFSCYLELDTGGFVTGIYKSSNDQPTY